MSKICKNSSVKNARDTEKFHLRGPVAQTMGSIEKLDISKNVGPKYEDTAYRRNSEHFYINLFKPNLNVQNTNRF